MAEIISKKLHFRAYRGRVLMRVSWATNHARQMDMEAYQTLLDKGHYSKVEWWGENPATPMEKMYSQALARKA